MKRCPTCNRTFADDGQRFCLEDGATLIEETPAPFDPQATIAMPGAPQTNPPSNPYGSGAGGQSMPGSGAGGPGSYGSGAGGQGSYGSGAGQGAYGSGAGHQSQPPPPPSWTPPTPSFSPQAQAQAPKRSILPWVLGIGAVLVLGFIGIVVAIVMLASSSNSNNSNNSNANRASTNTNSNNSNTNSTKANTNTTTRTGTPITSPNGKLQITAPSTWRSTTDLNDKADLQATDKSNEMYLIVLTDDKSNYNGMTLDKHSKETLGTLTKAMTSSTKTGPTSLTINDNPAVQYEVRGTIKNLNVVYVHTTVETSDNFQQIVAWTLQSTYDLKKDVVQDVVQSFKETGR